MSLFCNFFQMVRNIILPSFWSTTPTTKNFRRQTHLGLPHQDGIIYNQSVSVPPTMTYIAIGTMLGVVWFTECPEILLFYYTANFVTRRSSWWDYRGRGFRQWWANFYAIYHPYVPLTHPLWNISLRLVSGSYWVVCGTGFFTICSATSLWSNNLQSARYLESGITFLCHFKHSQPRTK